MSPPLRDPRPVPKSSKRNWFTSSFRVTRKLRPPLRRPHPPPKLGKRKQFSSNFRAILLGHRLAATLTAASPAIVADDRHRKSWPQPSTLNGFAGEIQRAAQVSNGAMRTASGTPQRTSSPKRPAGTAAASARIIAMSCRLKSVRG